MTKLEIYFEFFPESSEMRCGPELICVTPLIIKEGTKSNEGKLLSNNKQQ